MRKKRIKDPDGYTKTDMTKSSGRNTPAGLREQAEKRLQSQMERLIDLSELDVRRLVHELGTHQIELEMQNEELRRAMEELEESRSRYAELYDFSPVGYLTFDGSGIIREANLTAAGMLGQNRRVLVNKPFSLFIPDPADRAVFDLHCRDVLNKQTFSTREITVRRKDGTQLPILLESVAVNDHKGKITGLRTVISDITGRRKTENELKQANDDRAELARVYSSDLQIKNEELKKEIAGRRESEERARHLAIFPQLNPNPVIEVDASGNVIFANPATKRILESLGMDGNDTSAFLPQDLYDIWRAWDGHTEPAVTRQVAVRDRVFSETILVVPQLGVARIYAHDITRRVKAEEALRASEERYRLLVDQSPDAVIVIKDGRFVFVNPSALLLHGAKRQEQMIGYPVKDFLQPDDFERVRGGIAAAEKEGLSSLSDIRIRRLDGKYVWTEGSGVAVSYDGRPAVQVIIRDITDRRRAEEELRMARLDMEHAQEVAGIGSWRLDVQKNILTWSDENHRIFGIPKGTPLTYEAFLATVHPDDRTHVDTQWQAGLRGEPYDIEHRIVVDGRVKWVREKAYLEFDSEGTLLGGFGITQNITERKQAADELQKAHDELEERVRVRTSELSGLNDDLEAEVYERRKTEKRLARINSLYSILFRVNEAIVRIHDSERLFEQTCRIVVDSGLFKMAWIGFLDPQTSEVRPVARAGDSGRYLDRVSIIARDVPEGRGPTGRAVAEGKAMVCPDIENDPAMAPFREAALKEGFRSSAAFPLRAGSATVGALTVYADSPRFFTDEEIRLLSSLSEDISFAIETMAGEQKRIDAELSLQASAEEIRDLYNNAPCGYHSLDSEGRIVMINDTELEWLGYCRDEVIGKKMADFHTPESRRRFMQSFPKFLRTGSANDLEFDLVRKDGTILPVSINATAILDNDNNFVKSRSTVFDMTELRTSREQLRAFAAHLQEAREDERTKIAREIHDELGQILTAAGMEVSMLRNRYTDQAPIQKAASLVIGLLDKAVADMQRICEELRPRLLDHLGLSAAIKREAVVFAKRSGLSCSLDLAKIPALTDESAVALFRIVQEALTNVARHSGAKAVSIRLFADKRNIILEITDNGKGIPTQELGKSTSLA